MEDVLYLKQHADEEAFLFVVDSSRRDRAAYPDPNHYEVPFNSPFRNVVGLDLIDAFVPRTEYLVEAGKNRLAYAYDGFMREAVVEPGDYNVLQLCEALTAALAPGMQVRPVTTPVELVNRVEVVAEGPFTLHAARSTLAKALGMGSADIAARDIVEGLLGTQTVKQGPLPATATVDLTTGASQALVSPYAGAFESLLVYLSSPEPRTVTASVSSGGVEVARGEATTTGAEFEHLAIALSPLRAVDRGAACVVTLTAPDVRVFGSEDGSELCLDARMRVDGYVARPPGVVNLTGEPYVMVRVPEIEALLFRDRAFERVHAGMGLVKLASYGFREQRFDFNSFPSRRLPTPLGKLGKITVRLERGDGSLYDCKGVDHHLVFVVKYLELTKGPESMRSTLNPHYQPNTLTYLQNRQIVRR